MRFASEDRKIKKENQECEHTHCVEFDSLFEISDLEFRFRASKCTICDTLIWTDELEQDFSNWLQEQSPEHFVIEDIPIESELMEFATMESKQHNLSLEDYLKVCLNEYILSNKDIRFQRRVESMVLPSGEFTRVSLLFDPLRYLNLVENASEANIPDKEFTGRLIETILCMKREVKSEMLDLWIPSGTACFIKPYLSRRANEEVLKENVEKEPSDKNIETGLH